jgi:hypothetical protein
MPRDERTLLESRLEVLEARQRTIEAEEEGLERQLALEKQRYDAAVAHWRAGGRDAILTPDERAAADRELRKMLLTAFAIGVSVPLAGGFLIFL